MGKVYLLSGDPLLVDEELQRLKKELLPSPSPWNEFIFEGETPGKASEEAIREVSAALQTQPLFGGTAWILVKRAWTGTGRKGKSSEDGEDSSADEGSQEPETSGKSNLLEAVKPLASLIEEQKGEFPNNLVLVAPPQTAPAKTNPLVKAVQKWGVAIDKPGFNPYRPEEALRWIAGLGYEIEPSAARLLVERIGPDTLLLKNSLERLYLYEGGKKILLARVEALIPEEEDEAMLLYDTINQRNPIRALEVLRDLLSQPKSHPLQLLAMLTTFYRRTLAVKFLQKEFKSPERTVARLKELEEAQKIENRLFKRTPASPRDLYLYTQKCPFSYEALVSILRELLAVDQKLKSSVDPEAAFLVLFQQAARLK